MAGVEVRSAAGGQQIWITERTEMLRIMRHEFSNGTDFDPAPLAQYLSTLTVEQVKLLMSYPFEKYTGKHRLVAFITLDEKNTDLPMCADQCDPPASTLIRSNSHFALFHCNGVAQRVSLVCYTKEFNLFAGRPTLDKRDATMPTVYKISAMDMTGIPSTEGDTIWNRVSKVGHNDQGTAIYGGDATHAPNSMHGMINTAGCWMLFRNYNWYKPKQTEFIHVFQQYRSAGNKMTDPLRHRLKELGYGEALNDVQSRFFGWERNYAYTWFTRDIIGIDYFSQNPFVNEDNIYDSVQLAEYPPVPPPELVGVMDYNSHNWQKRHAKEKTFKLGADLWKKGNALGFQAAEGFTPFLGRVINKLESTSWADLYVYG